MKRFYALLVVLLLCLLAACGTANPQPAPTTTQATTTETTAPPTEPWVAPPPMPEGYSFDLYYAKTPTYFYVLGEYQEYYRAGCNNLIRVSLDNLDRREEIPLPETYGGHTLGFRAICGVTPDGIYVQGVSYEGEGPDREFFRDVVYRVPLDGGEAELVEDETAGNISSAWYNAASNSLLFCRELEMEALRLDTGQRGLIELPNPEQNGDGRWYHTDEGVLFCLYPNWYFINERNQPIKMNYTEEEIDEFEGRRKKPTDEAGILKQNELMHSFAVCGGWLYYVEADYPGVIGGPVRLYRMKPDGTKKTLLRETDYTEDIDSLEAIGGKLYAMLRYPIENASKAFNDIRLCRLDSNGKIAKTIYESGDGYFSWMHMTRLDDMILLYSDCPKGIVFAALYDPSTGIMFTG